jgi:hypothetical protein
MEQAYQPAERSQPQTKVIQKRGNIGNISAVSRFIHFSGKRIGHGGGKVRIVSNAAASSFSVSSAAGDEPTSAARADFTKQ